MKIRFILAATRFQRALRTKIDDTTLSIDRNELGPTTLTFPPAHSKKFAAQKRAEFFHKPEKLAKFDIAKSGVLCSGTLQNPS